MKKKQLFALFLSLILIVVSVVPCLGATTKEKISDARQEKEKTQSSLNSTKDRIQALETKKGETESYLTELNGQLADLQSKLEELQKKSEEKQKELEAVQKELEEARLQEEEQYEDMKLRIQYTYEKASFGYIDMLFSADGFVDFLNRAEIISTLVDYDRKMLEQYQNTKEMVAEKEKKVQQEQEEIRKLQNESFEQQEQVEELISETYLQMREYQENLETAKTEEAKLLAEINSQEEAINKLLKQAKDEEAAAAKKAAEEQRRKQEEEQKKEEKPSGGSSGSGNQGGSSGSGSTDSGQGKYLGRFKLTAYCACEKCCGKWAGGNTASGTRPTPGRTVAMAGVPFGTKLLINGHVYTVEDRGTAYGHVDIFQGSHAQALAFGMQYADVYQVG